MTQGTMETLETLTKQKKISLEKLCLEKGLSKKGLKKDLIKRLLKQQKSPQITRNNYRLYHYQKGMYLYSNLGFLFNKNTNAVVGKMDECDKMLPLTKADIEQCKELGFLFEIGPTMEGPIIAKRRKRLEDDIFSDEEDDG